MVKKINENTRRTENTKKIQSVIESIDTTACSYEIDLDLSHTFLMEGSFEINTKKGPKSVYCFLFDSAIVFAKPIKNRVSTRTSTVKRRGSLFTGKIEESSYSMK
eukprot:Pgem_evm1s14208